MADARDEAEQEYLELAEQVKDRHDRFGFLKTIDINDDVPDSAAKREVKLLVGEMLLRNSHIAKYRASYRRKRDMVASEKAEVLLER